MNIILRNLTEEVVLRRLKELSGTLPCCQCERCRLDLATYALNRLPARYVATTQGELLSKLDSLDTQFEATVTAVITQATIVVGKKPYHEQ